MHSLRADPTKKAVAMYIVGAALVIVGEKYQVQVSKRSLKMARMKYMDVYTNT